MATGRIEYQTTEETTNFARLSRITMDVLPAILWNVLCCGIDPANLPKEMQRNVALLEEYLQKKIVNKFCPYNKRTRIPIPVADDFDVSALYVLLRNLCPSVPSPSKGWGRTPDSADKNLGDDIERVRLFRDRIGHRNPSSMSSAEFRQEFLYIKDVVQRFDVFFQRKGKTIGFTDAIMKLRDCYMDEALQRKYIQQMQEKAEISDKLSRLECKIDGLVQTVDSVRSHQLEHEAQRNDTNTGQEQGVTCSAVNGVDKSKDLVFDERNQPGGADISTMTKEADVDNGHSAPDTAFLSAVQTREDSRGNKKESDKIILLKLYDKLKSELTRELGTTIVKVMFKENCQDILEEMNSCPRRRDCIESLLKRIISGKSADVSAFLNVLKSVCPEMDELLAQTRVTDRDRKNFQQINYKARAKETFSSQVDKRHVRYFQYRPEVTSHINDVLLSRFHLSIEDHSDFTEHLSDRKTVHFLLQMILSCHLDLNSGLQNVLESEMYTDWKEFENDTSESTDQEYPGIWYSIYEWMKLAATSLMGPICRSFNLVYLRVRRGSLILKFLAGDNFSTELLKPESVKRKLRELLEETHLRFDFQFKGPVHVMVFIKSPKNAGKEEIHFYLETDKAMKELEGCQSHKERYDIDYMVEEMDPAPLKHWMIENVEMDKSTRNLLEDTVSWKTKSRRDKMKVLMDIMRRVENGFKMLEGYCEKNDQFVYNRVFAQMDQRTELAYERREGLQKLFSTWIDFSEDPREEKMMSADLKELDLLPSGTLEETTLEEQMRSTFISDDMKELCLLPSETELSEEEEIKGLELLRSEKHLLEGGTSTEEEIKGLELLRSEKHLLEGGTSTEIPYDVLIVHAGSYDARKEAYKYGKHLENDLEIQNVRVAFIDEMLLNEIRLKYIFMKARFIFLFQTIDLIPHLFFQVDEDRINESRIILVLTERGDSVDWPLFLWEKTQINYWEYFEHDSKERYIHFMRKLIVRGREKYLVS